MLNIITIIGARPQFIKAATVSRVINTRNDISEKIIHTGQHYDGNMSDIFFDELNIPTPDYNLGIGGNLHGQMTGQQLEKIEEILLQEKPDRVLVYGDTNSTLAGALAAVKLNIPVAHIEAGLRSFNKKMPEEINRVITDHIADLLFSPTETAVANLINEGIDQEQIILSGDVMYDAALYYADKAESKIETIEQLSIGSHYVLVTLHRAENTDSRNRLEAIVNGLAELAANKYSVVLPLHPRTRKKLCEYGLWEKLCRSIRIIDPVGYLEMVLLEKNASLIITDSGGVQKEAYFHKTPCITLRDETEWVELLDIGWNKLCDVKQSRWDYLITQFAGQMQPWEPIYGTGNAAQHIVSQLVEQAR